MPLNYKLKQQLIYIYTVDIVTLINIYDLIFKKGHFLAKYF